MRALAWLLASDESPEEKVRQAIAQLREYGFDESAPLDTDYMHDTPIGQEYGDGFDTDGF